MDCRSDMHIPFQNRYKDLDTYLQNRYVRTTLTTGIAVSLICAAALLLIKSKL